MPAPENGQQATRALLFRAAVSRDGARRVGRDVSSLWVAYPYNQVIGDDMTKIMPCTCTHAGQDRLYGTGRRVHNNYIKSDGGWRCTVCGNEKPDKHAKAQE